MKYMRIIAIALSFIFALALLTGCGGTANEPADPNANPCETGCAACGGDPVNCHCHGQCGTEGCACHGAH